VDDDWLADPANKDRRDALQKRVWSASPEQLLEIVDEVNALAVDVGKWKQAWNDAAALEVDSSPS